MNRLIQGINRFIKEDEGVTMVEYGLLAALIAVVCVVAVAAIGTNLNTTFNHIKDCLANSANC